MWGRDTRWSIFKDRKSKRSALHWTKHLPQGGGGSRAWGRRVPTPSPHSKCSPGAGAEPGEDAPHPPPHLIHLVPLRTEVLLDDLALEDLVANSNHSVGVWLPLDKSLKVSVFSLKILSFNKVYSQDTLERGKTEQTIHRFTRRPGAKAGLGTRQILSPEQRR